MRVCIAIATISLVPRPIPAFQYCTLIGNGPGDEAKLQCYNLTMTCTIMFIGIIFCAHMYRYWNGAAKMSCI